MARIGARISGRRLVLLLVFVDSLLATVLTVVVAVSASAELRVEVAVSASAESMDEVVESRDCDWLGGPRVPAESG